MRSTIFHAPPPLLSLVATILLTPVIANPLPRQAGLSFDGLFARQDCSGGQLCGWNQQLCCSAGSACYTDTNDQAQCTTVGVAAASSSAGGGGGYWAYFTTTYTTTNLETITSTGSYQAQATARCNYALDETPCGSTCCASGQYCSAGTCVKNDYDSTATNGGGGAVTVTATTSDDSGVTGVAGPPILGTSSGNILTTETVSPTTTVPYQTPIATGANVTMTEENGGGGLSGGAIAGIVVGVLVGLALLGLLCFYCCLKGLLDGCLALFGLGGRKRKRTEVEEYERRTHHSSRGGGRTWYGAAKPSRVDRRDRRESHAGRNAAGVLGGLGALWAVLGLKRHHNRRKEEKDSYYSYSESSYLGTSESSASSDRRTRYSRAPPRSVARSMSRR